MLFLALWLHPRYKNFGDSIARDGSGGMGLVLVTEWVDGYLDRWLSNIREEKLGNLSSIVSGLCAWEDMSDPTLRHAEVQSISVLENGEGLQREICARCGSKCRSLWLVLGSRKYILNTSESCQYGEPI
jgi:hypothetical protein